MQNTIYKTVAEKKNIESLSGCFQHLNEEELKFLNEKKTQVSYLKGETLFKQGAFAPHVLFVCSGLVKVFLQIGQHKQVTLRLAKTGDYLAFSTLFNKKTYPYSAQALTDATLCMIDKEALKTILVKNPELAMQLTTRNSLNENRYLTIIKNLSYKQMRGKLASALLYLSSEQFQGLGVFTHLTRQDIAAFATITMESTVKLLKEFEKDGLIALKGKEIYIVNRERLIDINQKG